MGSVADFGEEDRAGRGGKAHRARKCERVHHELGWLVEIGRGDGDARGGEVKGALEINSGQSLPVVNCAAE